MRTVFALMAMLSIFCGGAYADTWAVSADHIDPHQYFGESMANGAIGLSGSANPFQTQQTLIYGAYEPMWPGSVTGSVRSFNFLDLQVHIDGALIDSLGIRNLRQVLDFKKAVLTTSFDYGDKATVTYALRALREMPYSALLDVSIIAHKAIKLSVSAELNAPRDGLITVPESHTFAWLTDIQKSVKNAFFGTDDDPYVVRLASARATGATGAIRIGAAQTFLFQDWHKAPTLSTDEQTVSFTKDIHPGEEFRFASLGSTITSAQVADPGNEAQRLTAEGATRGLNSLIEGHERAWAKLWKSDVLIEGDEQAQRDIHGIIYHLYESVRDDVPCSIPPMGLSGNTHDYLGHIFWDAEMWIFPPLLALHPELARSMLEYRFQRLDAARRNAVRHGYRGAQYPWESAATGDEDTWVESSTGSIQIHITADVALAAWNYYRVTKDKEWLASRGFPMIQAAADFWVSRVSREGPGRYAIRHITAADESADYIDNDAFTNAAAQENLRIAAAAARVLGKTPDPEWAEVAANIPILKFPDGVIREHETYHGQQTWQADVTLLAYPLGVITDPSQIKRDLAYYNVDRYDNKNGPAMMISNASLLYERLGQPERAYELFEKSYQPNQRPPFGALAESATSDNPYFLTGAGGVLQTLLYGFGGLRITDEGFQQTPLKLPAAWRALTLTGIGSEAKTFVQASIGKK